MKTKNYVLYVVLLSFLAGIVDLVTNLIEGQELFGIPGSFTFITFTCWALYFLFGANLKGAAKGYLSILSGAICAVFMFYLTFAFDITVKAWWAIPLAVFFVVLIMVPQEKIKAINLAGVFAGTGLFFAADAAGAVTFLDAAGNFAPFGVRSYAIGVAIEMLYALIGLTAGYLTIKLYGFCAGLGAKKEEAKQ